MEIRHSLFLLNKKFGKFFLDIPQCFFSGFYVVYSIVCMHLICGRLPVSIRKRIRTKLYINICMCRMCHIEREYTLKAYHASTLSSYHIHFVNILNELVLRMCFNLSFFFSYHFSELDEKVLFALFCILLHMYFGIFFLSHFDKIHSDVENVSSIHDILAFGNHSIFIAA